MKPVQVTIENVPATLYKQSHALLIGVSNYSNGLKPLPGVSGDIQAVKVALETNGFNVRVVMDPDNVGLVNAFNDFIGQYGSGKDNRLLFYFAGHGYTRKIYSNEIGYLLPVNCPNPVADPAGFQLRAMPMGQIELFAQQIQSKHALFLFDACFSGAVFAQSRDIPGIINYKTTQPVRQFITSGSAEETVPDQSIFRRQFIAALTGEADLNKDNYITGTELGDFLQTTVVNYSRNSLHPQFGKIRDPELDKGDFVFVLGPGSAAQPGTATATPTITSERTLVKYGSLELTTEISGALYVDGTYMKQVGANTALTLNNLTEGTHTVKVAGDETVEKTVTIYPNQTGTLHIDKKRPEAASWMPEMVFVQGGTFQMGSNDGEDDEKPVHTITLNSFYIGKYEVTQKQWREVMGSDPPELYFKGCDQCPVENVSWDDVQEYLKKLNARSGKIFRLPTEAEWEYAARGGNQSRGYTYSGGNNLDEVAWYDGNSGNKIHPVGQKRPNELGLYDMSGNVWERCKDWYGEDFYKTSPAIEPKGPSTGSYRVLRGGSWYLNAQYCRTSLRGYGPDYRLDYLGCRLVLVP
jgi:formylglycine-generating enzyme required for sulfatase activity